MRERGANTRALLDFSKTLFLGSDDFARNGASVPDLKVRIAPTLALE